LRKKKKKIGKDSLKRIATMVIHPELQEGKHKSRSRPFSCPATNKHNNHNNSNNINSKIHHRHHKPINCNKQTKRRVNF
jgi:hypothetical protein